RELAADPAQADESEELLGPDLGRDFLAPIARRREHRIEEIRLQPRVHPDEDVLLGGHAREQADVLERPADPGLDDVVGPGTPEEPDSAEQPLVTSRTTER